MAPRQRILLLQPAVGEWDGMRSSPALPLSLLHAAAIAVADWDVRIYDRRLHGDDWADRLREELRERPVLVGVTAFTGPMIRSALELCDVVRATVPGVPIAWGGVHPSLLPPERTLADPRVDFVVQGEGERVLPALARAVAEGRPPAGIPGVWWRDADGVHGSAPALIDDLDALPDPPWHLVDIARYQPEYLGRRSIYLQSSRGCPFRCAYCYNGVFNARRWRGLSAERTLAQVRTLVRDHGVRDLYFVDDMFFTDPARARAIAEGMAPLGITWQVQGVDILGLKRLTDADLDLLVRAGCTRMSVGIESGSPRMRKRIHKTGTIDDVVAVATRMARHPIILYCSFMCALPGETDDDVRMTVDLAFELLRRNPNIRISPFYNFSPYPGTEMFDQAVALGLQVPDSLAGWAGFGHSRTNLDLGRRRFYESLYFTSLFLDDKAREYGMPPWAVALARLYRPVARFRTRHLFFAGLVEKEAMAWITGAWARVRGCTRV